MDALDAVQAFLERTEIPHKRIDASTLAAQMRGEHKLTIPVGFAVLAEQVVLESFFMRRPMENKERFYDLLLRRNMGSNGVYFAIDHEGDVHLVARIPAASIDDAVMDRILGALLVEADGMFDPAIEIGFASYLESDLAWRAKMAQEMSPK